MKRLILLLPFLAACTSKPKEAAAPAPKVDNTVVRYTESLKYDVQKAKEAQGKANAAIAREQAAAAVAAQATE